MTTAQKRRERVLQQLNSRLMDNSEFGLGVTGSKIPLQYNRGTYIYKPSKIPRPEASPRPLPAPGYVSENTERLQTEERHNPWQHPLLPLGVDNLKITSKRTPPGKKLTIVIHASSEEKHSGDLVSRSKKQKPSTLRVGENHKRATVESLHERERVKPMKPTKQKVDTRHSKKRGVPAVKTRHRYDWGKNGQKNELKIRFLARKYYMMWCRHVFGRVAPSTARDHYQIVLKKKAFTVWYEQWWVARREWKLNIRAECHNRYRLWQLIWKVWTEYVQVSRLKKAKNEKSKNMVSLRLKNLAWKGWCEYVAKRRERKAVILETTNWSQERLTRSTWQRWISAVSERRHMFMMDTAALHHWARSLQKKAWVNWLHCYQERLLLKQKHNTASSHHGSKLLTKCWDAWLTYIDSRRLKHHGRGVAVEHHANGLVVKIFTCWKMRYFRARQIEEFQELVESKGKVAILRRVFGYWQYYIALKRHKAYQNELATLCYKVTLKSKVLHNMSRHALQQQQELNHKHLASHFHVTKRLSNCWRVWLQRCEHCEEIKMGTQTRAARSHFASILLRKMMEMWKAFTAHRRERKRLHHSAEEQFRSVALPKYFTAMKDFVAICYYKRDLQQTSATFRRETLLSMVFYKWWRTSHFSQDMRMLERVAILHSEEVAKKKLWRLWKSCTLERVKHFEQEEIAVVHHQFGLMAAAFNKWRARYQESLKSVCQTKRAVEHHSCKIVRLAWCAWTKHVTKKRASHAISTNATNHYQKRLLSVVIEAWKVYYAHRRVRNIKKSTAIHFHHCLLKKHAMIRWSTNVRLCKMQYNKEQEAITYHVKRNLRKYFGVWHERRTLSVERAQLENNNVLEAWEHLQRNKMARILFLWKQHTEIRMKEKLIVAQAELHHSRVVGRKCFVAWYDNHRLKLRKSLLQRQCVWFHNTRLLSTCYSKWRLELMNALMLKRKNMLALWHWSQSLERKVLVAWLLHTSQRKRKASRYAQAMERHRNRLLTIGVTQWIKMATQAKAQREETTLQLQVMSTQAKVKCVRKCALRWKAIVRKRRVKSTARTQSLQHTHALITSQNLPSTGSSIPGRQQETHSSNTRPHLEGSELWNSLARKLQIPDAPVSRAPPRRINLLATHTATSIPQLNSDFMPRPPIHPRPSSPPVQYPHKIHTHGDSTLTTEGSYTFLPSTYSEETLCGTVQPRSPERSSQHPNRRHTDISQHSTEPLVAGTCSPGVSITVSQHHVQADTFKKRTQTLLPPSAFEKPKLTSAPTETLKPKLPKKRSVKPGPVQTRIPQMREVIASSASLPGNLSDPAVQAEIIQMRDELRQFYDLKAHHKLLEEQISLKIEQGTPSDELQRETEVTAQKIKQHEPLVKNIAVKLSKLLAQCPT